MLALAVAGTVAELVLLEHYEDWQQWIPLVVLGGAGLVLAWHTHRESVASRRALRLVMAGLVLAGLAGVVLHVRGNLEFEREISPDASGFTLWFEVLRGATPALAPGALVPFGLLGLLYSRSRPSPVAEDS